MSTVSKASSQFEYLPSAPDIDLYHVERIHDIGLAIRSSVGSDRRMTEEAREQMLRQLQPEEYIALKQQDPEAFFILFPSEIYPSTTLQEVVRVEDVSLPLQRERDRRMNVYPESFTKELMGRIKEATAFIRSKDELVSFGAEPMPDVLAHLSAHLDKGVSDEKEAVLELRVMLEQLKELNGLFEQTKTQVETLEPICVQSFHQLKTEVEACRRDLCDHELSLKRMKRAAAEDEEQKKNSWWITTLLTKLIWRKYVPTPQIIQAAEESLKKSTYRIDDLERKLSAAAEAVGVTFRQGSDVSRFITLVGKIKGCIEGYLEILERKHIEIQMPTPAAKPSKVSADGQDRYRLRPTIPAPFFAEFEKGLADMNPKPADLARISKRLAEIKEKNTGGFPTHDAAVGEIHLLMGEMRDFFGGSCPLVSLCNKEIAIMMEDAIRLSS